MLLKIKVERKRILYCVPVLLLAMVILWSFMLINQKTFYSGISIAGTDVSGLEREQALHLIEDKMQGVSDSAKLTLKYRDKIWQIPGKDISLRYMTDNSVSKAYVIGREGNVLRRIFQIVSLKVKPVSFEPLIGYDRGKMLGLLSKIKQQIDKKEKDATVFYKKGNILLDKEETGFLLQIDKNASLVDNQIRNRNFTINLDIEEVTPRITMESISEIKDVFSTFSTQFNPGDENRSYNIHLASEKINGMILMPQDIFSMHKALGPRTLENGYKEAPVIYDNELVPGTGGGVCQVTTTLYNAVLLSKIEVLQRTHHSMPLGYVKPGQDATIAEDYIDFKFQNSTGYPICIIAEVVKNTLNIRILGKREGASETVKLKPEVIEEYIPEEEELIVDNNIADNERVTVREAKKGMKVILYRESYDESGKLLEREKISEDVYKPVKAQVKVNQKYYDELNANVQTNEKEG